MSLLVDIRKQLGQFRLDVSFETGGGVLGILGASGCGKSYTLKCIAGIARPDAGRIVLNGKTLFDSKEKICLPPQKREVGYLFQSYALFPHMTVEQNILCGLRREKDKAERAAVLAELYELLQLRGHGLEGMVGQKRQMVAGRVVHVLPRGQGLPPGPGPQRARPG